MDRTTGVETYGESAEWRYEPGLLELVEAGAGVDELPANTRGASTSRGSSNLDRIVDFLRGFRFDRVLCEREPIWVPIATVWPVRGGTAEFSYQVSSERADAAEIHVFAAGGYGGASSRTVSKGFHWAAEAAGRELSLRAYLSIKRYVRNDGRHLDRVDVDCSGEVGDYRQHQLAEAERPLAGATPSTKDVRGAGYVITDIARLRDVAGPTGFDCGTSERHSWSFGPNIEIPLLQSSFTLQAQMERAQAFAATLTLPGGADYAVCAPVGQAPVVPLCVPVLLGPNEA